MCGLPSLNLAGFGIFFFICVLIDVGYTICIILSIINIWISVLSRLIIPTFERENSIYNIYENGIGMNLSGCFGSIIITKIFFVFESGHK